MKKGVFAFCISFIFLSMTTGCRPYASPAPSAASAAPPQASRSLSPPVTPLPSAIASITPGGIPQVTPANSEAPVPAAKGLGGTIPKDQPFSSYTSTAGNYDVQYPDGWAAQASGESIRFAKGWSGMEVNILHTADPITLEAIKTGQVPGLIISGRAVAVKNVTAVNSKSGAAVLVEYECNSELIDKKQVRLENQRYYFYHNGTLAALTLWAPMGAGNWKVWAQMADAFAWRQP